MLQLSPLLKNRIINISSNNISYIYYREPKITLQNGLPQCGLVSLIMAGDTLHLTNKPTVKQLFDVAFNNGYTKKGEMFSVNWLCKLGEIFWGDEASFDVLPSLPEENDLVIDLYENEAIYLIPYDCSKNFEPTCNNGANAHWCVITGFLLKEKKVREDCKEDLIKLYNCKEKLDIKNFHVYVIGYQGKSRHSGLWDYKVLKSSNLQLNVCRSSEIDEFQLDINGMEDLRGKCIRIKNK
uniref:Actin maturation protease n=1 Tax=Parastrongyloides trichosuri TaxID=131310 RepID=A0A0N4ZPG8_PARTI